MKFKVEADLEFEAESADQAFLKLAQFFLTQMEHKPVLTSPHGNKPFAELLQKISKGDLLQDATGGGIGLDFADIYDAPRMMQ